MMAPHWDGIVGNNLMMSMVMRWMNMVTKLETRPSAIMHSLDCICPEYLTSDEVTDLQHAQHQIEQILKSSPAVRIIGAN